VEDQNGTMSLLTGDRDVHHTVPGSDESRLLDTTDSVLKKCLRMAGAAELGNALHQQRFLLSRMMSRVAVEAA
jgi:hypothetical protein